MNTEDDEVTILVPCGNWDLLSRDSQEKLKAYSISGSVIPGKGMAFRVGRSRLDEIYQDSDLRVLVKPTERNKKDLALEAVLLFHDGGPWLPEKRQRWNEIAVELLGPPKFDDFHYARYVANPDTWECTTKVLCNMVRAAR